MTLSHRTTEVERIEDIAAVEDDDGNQQSPANTAEQQAIRDAVDTIASYPNGNCRDEDGAAYPYSENPDATIRELGFQVITEPVAVEITTTGGDVFTVPIESTTVLNRWAIDSITVLDPNGAQSRVSWWWAGK